MIEKGVKVRINQVKSRDLQSFLNLDQGESYLSAFTDILFGRVTLLRKRNAHMFLIHGDPEKYEDDIQRLVGNEWDVVYQFTGSMSKFEEDGMSYNIGDELLHKNDCYARRYIRVIDEVMETEDDGVYYRFGGEAVFRTAEEIAEKFDLIVSRSK
jgi:hypothetical protein